MTFSESFAHWQILLATGTLLAISEIFIPGFIMLPIGIGFLLTAVVSAFTQNLAILLGALAFFELVILWAFQGPLKKYHAKTRIYSNAEGMIGSECIVVEAAPKGGSGYVKLYGDTWVASHVTGEALKKGSKVVIVKLDGNKVVVE